MKTDEIRGIPIPDREFGNPISEVKFCELTILREIAAQLAEYNSNLRVRNALRGGGGWPDA